MAAKMFESNLQDMTANQKVCKKYYTNINVKRTVQN